MDAPLLLTTTEFAEALKVSRRAVQRWVKEGDVRAVKLPGRRSNLRIPQAELDRLLASADLATSDEPAA
jgi:excisionase family DNA binding protein